MTQYIYVFWRIDRDARLRPLKKLSTVYLPFTCLLHKVLNPATINGSSDPMNKKVSCLHCTAPPEQAGLLVEILGTLCYLEQKKVSICLLIVFTWNLPLDGRRSKVVLMRWDHYMATSLSFSTSVNGMRKWKCQEVDRSTWQDSDQGLVYVIKRLVLHNLGLVLLHATYLHHKSKTERKGKWKSTTCVWYHLFFLSPSGWLMNNVPP